MLRFEPLDTAIPEANILSVSVQELILIFGGEKSGLFLLHLKGPPPAPCHPHGCSLTQCRAVPSSGQCTSVTVGQYSHLAALGGCPLQKVLGSQIPNASIVLEVFLQHVLSIADHSGADKELSASAPRPRT